MDAQWQVQEAKSRFSELIDRALRDGPQTITRHGKPVVRVVAMSAEEGCSQADDGFAELLLSAPKVGSIDLPIRRSRKHRIGFEE